ncbi:lipid IV(A) 3-deoxy-D-manno-octulosonic acid transferase [Arsenophonus symbiont of Ornithomya chloropus]|uniref:lipid IV(A) 3-deoxy-D-manno-octulosonic acid transferase n=1 Tax=Arsenophonus symbiont of Ornithomya chloropus TaxID=634121 RepID=UPI0032B2D6D2
MFFLYQILMYLIQPIILCRLLWNAYKYPAYLKRWNERYGFYNSKVIPGGILLHSVSVGETLAAFPLVKILRHYYPELPITITTMTPTGSERVLSEFGNNVYHVYLPYDLIGSVVRFINQINPKLTIIMEKELWPNLIIKLRQRKIPLIIANARMSEKSAINYQKLGCFIEKLLQKITLIAVQNKEDGERFIKLGLPRKKISVIGNLKFDIHITPELEIKTITLRQKWALLRRPVWIASSTHDGEESIILEAHIQLLKKFPDLLLILVPRHPERFKYSKELTKKSKLHYILKSKNTLPNANTQVIIGDTMGELMLLYGIADLAFIGGSLVKKGGHNPLEAAIHAIPILMGPHTFNFQDICNSLKKINGLITVNNTQSLIVTISNLLKNKNVRSYHGHQAAELVYKNQGVSEKLIKLLKPYLKKTKN